MHRKSSQILTGKDEDAIQQPLDNKTGRTNPRFDKLYGHKTKNPWAGTERDRKFAGQRRAFGFSEQYSQNFDKIK